MEELYPTPLQNNLLFHQELMAPCEPEAMASSIISGLEGLCAREQLLNNRKEMQHARRWG